MSRAPASRQRAVCTWWLVTYLLRCAQAQVRGSEKHSLEQRLDYARREVASRPKDFQALVTLATTLHQIDHSFPDGGKRVPEAKAAYTRAIALAPTKAFGALLEGNLGALLMSAGRLPEALTWMEKGIASSTAENQLDSTAGIGILFNRGKALSMMDREAEAQAAYRRAKELAAGTAPAIWTKSCASLKDVTPEELRQMEDAATFLMYGTGIASAVKSKRHARQQMAAALLHQQWGWLEGSDPADTCWLFFALYAALDAKGDHEKAWSYLKTANAQQKGSHADEKRQDEQLLAILTSIFKQPKAGKTPGTYEALLSGAAGLPDKTPVFVVGMPRSGSTLVEQILSSHPEAFGAGEDTALAPLMPSLYKVLDGEGGQVSLRAIAAVGEAYVQEMRQRVPKGKKVTRIVDKMLRNAWNLGHIAMILPEAHVVWVVRHPMDVVLSCFAQPFEGRGTPWAWDLEDIAHQIQLTHAIMEHWEKVLPLRILRLPYEEIIADLEATSRQLLRHCRMPWDNAVLDFYRSGRPVQTASLLQVRRKLYNSSVGKWRRYHRHLTAIEEKLRPLIERYEKGLRKAGLVKSLKDEL